MKEEQEIKVVTIWLPDDTRTELTRINLNQKRSGIRQTVAQLAVMAIGVGLAAFDGEGQVLDTRPIDKDNCVSMQLRWPVDMREKVQQVMQAYNYPNQQRAAVALIEWWVQNQN